MQIASASSFLRPVSRDWFYLRDTIKITNTPISFHFKQGLVRINYAEILSRQKYCFVKILTFWVDYVVKETFSSTYIQTTLFCLQFIKKN